MAKRDEIFRGGMATLGLTFNREPAPLLDTYWAVLGDLTDVEMTRAFGRAVAECRFFPVPAELRAFARPPRDLVRDTALAWEAVRAAMDQHDYTTSVDFGPLVNAVVRNLGGWQELCGAKLSDLVWRRKDFERVYAAFVDKDPLALHGGPLRGALPGAIVAIEIEGQPSPARALPAADGASRAAARDLIRELAESKSA